MREIEKVLMERKGAISESSIGTETSTEASSEPPIPVRVDLKVHECIVPLASDVGMVTTQVA
jgi:hypothetical protein